MRGFTRNPLIGGWSKGPATNFFLIQEFHTPKNVVVGFDKFDFGERNKLHPAMRSLRACMLGRVYGCFTHLRIVHPTDGPARMNHPPRIVHCNVYPPKQLVTNMIDPPHGMTTGGHTIRPPGASTLIHAAVASIWGLGKIGWGACIHTYPCCFGIHIGGKVRLAGAHASTLIHGAVASILGVRLGWLGRMHPH
jgi:hypothetical protein